MKTIKTGEGYQHVMPYLILKDAADFIEFMKNVFEAEVRMTVPRGEGGGIMHGELLVGESVIMFADATDVYTQTTAGMFVYVENADKAYQLALENGATSIMPPCNQDYGRTSGVKDKFGNTWWITSVL